MVQRGVRIARLWTMASGLRNNYFATILRVVAPGLLLCLSSCWMLRAYKVRKLKLTDHKKLPSVSIAAAANPFYFHTVKDHSRYKKLETMVDSVIAETETAAFLVIRNDSLIYEKYFMGFDANSILPSNSMAKSFTGTMVAIALSEGKIKSVDEPVTNYLPELGKNDDRFHEIRIRDLLDMRSGLDFNEGAYNLKDDAVKLGFRPNLTRHLLKVKIKEKPGKFKYQSANPLLLGLVLERATGQKLQEYFQEKLWKPIGAEHNATWNVDSKKRKHVINSAALNATARDFAKLGRLYLNKGKIKSKQVIGEDWVHMVSNLDTLVKYEGYKYQWWNKRGAQYYRDSLRRSVKVKINNKKQRLQPPNVIYDLGFHVEAFNAYGFLDQVLYVNPSKKLIIVRLGRGWRKGRYFMQDIYALGEKI